MRELVGRAGKVGEHTSSPVAIRCSGGEGFECCGECGEIRGIRGQRGRRLTEICDHGIQVAPKLRSISLNTQRDGKTVLVRMGMSIGRLAVRAMVVVVIATGSEEWNEEQE